MAYYAIHNSGKDIHKRDTGHTERPFLASAFVYPYIRSLSNTWTVTNSLCYPSAAGLDGPVCHRQKKALQESTLC